MDLGTTIKNLRRQRGQTQTEFASLCGITQTYLSQIEKNKKEPNLSVLEKISSELNIPMPILFFVALDEEDIPSKKREAFMIMAPAIKAFIYELFAI
jgi:XRE family transcriptional regulator, regulator of sulfur utilization